MKKLFRRWIANSQTTLHLALSVFFCSAWILGGLIASSAPESALPGRLRVLGYAGLFLTLLAVLAHAAVHGCNRFLLHYRETSRLPVRQLTLVCLFSAALILVPGAGLMFLCSAALPRLAKMLARLFLSGRSAAASAESAEFSPGAVFSAPDLSGLFETAETPAWVRIAEQLLVLAGMLLLAALILFALYRALAALFYRLTHRAVWDDDIRITLKPGAREQAERRDVNGREAADSGLRRIFFRDPDPRAQIRRIYKKTVLAGLARIGKSSRRQSFSCFWASPEELERLSGTEDALLHGAYEKARYSGHLCTDDEVRALRGHKI